MSDRTPVQIAADTAQQAHALHLRAITPGAFTSPLDLAGTIWEIQRALHEIARAVQESAERLESMHADGRIRTDDGSEPKERVSQTTRELRAAAHRVSLAHAALTDASRPLATLGATQPARTR